MKTLKNKELTKLIGRRLKEALGDSEGHGLPPGISDGLDALRRAEVLAGATGRGLVAGVGAGTEDKHLAVPPAKRDASGNGSCDPGP